MSSRLIPVLQQATREVHVDMAQLDMAQLIETTADRLRAEGEAIGRAEGEAVGRAEGELRAHAQLVLRALESRGVELSDSVRERILACADRDQLERWFDRALVARAAAELFAPEDE